MHTITLYTKPGCSLCDEALEVIEEVRSTQPFELTLINILDSLADYELYKHDIPVIKVNGAEIVRHHVTREQLVNALAS